MTAETPGVTIPRVLPWRMTWLLALAWVVVYTAMAGHQGASRWVLLASRPGAIETTTTHVFGHQTPAAIARGEVWRAVTSSFIHFDLAHLALNLIGLVLLGRIVEAWYGSGPLLAIYAVIALVGNLLSALAKLGLGFDPNRPSGGGSGVVVGLIALIAVVGWRSRSRFGQHVQMLMVGLLAMLALTGYLFPLHDNYGHAAGGVVGGLIGLAHPVLRRPGRWTRRGLGTLGALALLACFGLQARAHQFEAREQARRVAAASRLQAIRAATEELLVAQILYLELTRRGPRHWPRFDPIWRRPTEPPNRVLQARLRSALERVRSARVFPTAGPVADAARRLDVLAGRARDSAPTPGQYRAFAEAFAVLFRHLSQEAGRLVRPTRRTGVSGPPPARSSSSRKRG